MADKVNLQKSYSALNEKLAQTFDGAGVRRSFTVPYIEGQAADEHFNAVGQAATQAGGLGSNLLTSAHHAAGKGWGSGEGHTVGHSAAKLSTTIIPKDDENAKAAIGAAQTHLNNIAKLIGDDAPEVVTAKNQLNLVKPTAGAGMTLLDFGVMLLQVMHAPNQAVARAHSGTKQDGHAIHLRAPSSASSQQPQEAQEQPQEGAQPAGGAEDQESASASQGAPAAQAAPSSGAPASEQAQG
jgi:hypothetical protein